MLISSGNGMSDTFGVLPLQRMVSEQVYGRQLHRV